MTLQSGWITTFLTLWKSPEKRAKFSQLKCNELLHWEDESHPWGWIQWGMNTDKFRSVFNLLTHPFQGGIFIIFKGCFSLKTRWFLFFFNRYKGWKFYPKQINFLHLSGWNTGWFSTPKGLTVDRDRDEDKDRDIALSDKDGDIALSDKDRDTPVSEISSSWQ